MGKTIKHTRKLAYAAICLALCLVLPFLTGQIPQIGQMLSPMHIPVFLCGFLCGWPWGLTVGFIAPLLRGALFGMPALVPGGIAMAFELAAYGFLSGLLYRIFPKTTGYIYATLLLSMFCGRIVWGVARFLISGVAQTQFTFSMFLAGAIPNAIPGIILHLILVPLIVIAMERAKLIPGAAETFDALKAAGIPFAIGTACEIKNVEFIYEIFRLDRWFRPEHIIYDDRTFPLKPAPDVFLKAMERLGTAPEDCVICEDSKSGLTAAVRSGAGRVIARRSETSDPSLFADPKIYAVIDDFTGFSRRYQQVRLPAQESRNL